jgi:aspartate/methionine/tyrosine aminotransferase
MLRTIAAFDRIGEENAFAVLARANALIAQGRDVINLGIGQPDFRTDHIVEAVVGGARRTPRLYADQRHSPLRGRSRWPHRRFGGVRCRPAR